LRHSRAQRDLNDEVHLDIQNRADDVVRAAPCLALGPSVARIAFGARERFKEECRATNRRVRTPLFILRISLTPESGPLGNQGRR
jgi:hypothetical protein